MRNLIIIAFLLVFSSCLRLDSFLYNPDTSIEAYGYDSYEGEVEIEVRCRFSFVLIWFDYI